MAVWKEKEGKPKETMITIICARNNTKLGCNIDEFSRSSEVYGQDVWIIQDKLLILNAGCDQAQLGLPFLPIRSQCLVQRPSRTALDYALQCLLQLYAVLNVLSAFILFNIEFNPPFLFLPHASFLLYHHQFRVSSVERSIRIKKQKDK